jgi:signal transduction histidine kinase
MNRETMQISAPASAAPGSGFPAASAPRWLVNALAALVLAGILGYLYLKTEAVDYARHDRGVAALLHLKDIDHRWNVEALGARHHPAAAPRGAGALVPLAEEALEQLLSATAEVAEPGIAEALGNLRRELALKAELLERLRGSGAGTGPDPALAEQVLLLPTGARIDTLLTLLRQRFQHLLDEKELYRIYLVYYSAALLVLVAWVGSRLLHSLALLRDANEGLERRVQERTRELSEALRHLKESETLLIQSEKMSSLGQMVAGIAHEINTPLAYVKSSLQLVGAELPAVRGLVAECDQLLKLLADGQAGEEQLTAQFNRAAQAAERFREQGTGELDKLLADGLHGIQEISELVLSLKNFSRLDRSKVAQFNLNEGLESTLVIVRNLVKRKSVVKRYGDIPLITCWPSQVNQILLNLITNAAQATAEEGGVITLTTRREGDRAVAVEVEDNGHGIAEEVLPRIFDPFFTTKEVGRGTGLGLSIAYKIAEQHGGSIRVASRVGAGSRFTVILPLEPPPETAV